MISPGITISNHRLRWVVDGMRFTAPPHLMTIPVRKKFYICSDVSHTHTAKKNILQSWKTMVPVFWSVVFIAHDSHHQGFVKVRATQLRAIGGKYPQQTRFAEIQAMTKKNKGLVSTCFEKMHISVDEQHHNLIRLQILWNMEWLGSEINSTAFPVCCSWDSQRCHLQWIARIRLSYQHPCP